jgi:hypothetical protein
LKKTGLDGSITFGIAAAFRSSRNCASTALNRSTNPKAPDPTSPRSGEWQLSASGRDGCYAQSRRNFDLVRAGKPLDYLHFRI